MPKTPHQLKILLVDMARFAPLRLGVGYNPQFLKGIGREAERMNVECEDLSEPQSLLKNPEAVIKKTGASGILGRLSPRSRPEAQAWLRLAKKIPLVNLGIDPAKWYARSNFPDLWNVVTPDETNGMFQLIRHLVAEGHESFLFAGVDGFSYTWGRQNGFREALHHFGKQNVGEWIQNPPASLIRNLLKLFTPSYEKKNKTKYKTTLSPDVILFETDRLAGEFYLAAIKNRLTIPGKVAVTGFDDAPLRLPPFGANPFTTIHQDFEGQGRLALRMLREIILKKRPRTRQRVLCPVSLVIRTSSQKNSVLSADPVDHTFRLRTEKSLEDHHADSRPSYKIAKDLGYSQEYFLVKFGKVFGKKFTEALHDVRIDKAAFDLAHTRQTITEIQFKFGYETHQSFNRAFRRRKKMTPSVYREKHP